MTYIKGGLLYEAMILFNFVPFQNGELLLKERICSQGDNLKDSVDKGLRELQIQARRDQTGFELTKYQCANCFSKLPSNLGIYFSRLRCMDRILPI